MKTSDDGVKFIAQWEGFRASVYKDSAGLDTIGFGHLLKPGEKFDEPLTREAGLALLKKDVEIAERAVNALVKVKFSQTQFDALCSFVYNIGRGGFATSSALSAVNHKHWKIVPERLMYWVHAGGERVQGLVNRRQAEGNLFSEGRYV